MNCLGFLSLVTPDDNCTHDLHLKATFLEVSWKTDNPIQLLVEPEAAPILFNLLNFFLPPSSLNFFAYTVFFLLLLFIIYLCTYFSVLE